MVVGGERCEGKKMRGHWVTELKKNDHTTPRQSEIVFGSMDKMAAHNEGFIVEQLEKTTLVESRIGVWANNIMPLETLYMGKKT